MIRTSTGSIKVRKIIQKMNERPGKRKYTMANADSMEIEILPIAIASAEIRLTSSMRATGGAETLPDAPLVNSAL